MEEIDLGNKTFQQTKVNTTSNQNENKLKVNSTRKSILMTIMKLFFTSLLTAITIFAWYHGLKGPLTLFSWHLMSMSSAYLILMSQAILTIHDPWRPMEHHTKITLHWVLQGAALTCATFGFAAIYMNKVNLGKTHFHTTHANWGLWTFISTFLVVGGGVVAKYSFQLRTYMKPVISKLIHSVFGILVYAMSMTTICLAFYSQWWERQVGSDFLRVSFVLIIISSGIFVLFGSIIGSGKRFKSAFLSGART